MISILFHTAIKILIGWLLVTKVTYWLGLGRKLTTIIKIIGVLIIISALLGLL